VDPVTALLDEAEKRRKTGDYRSGIEDQVAPGLAVTMSLGLASIKPGATVAEALSSADQHLYAAKRPGRNRVEGQGVFLARA
jgi:GGDEF domain-containing protein